MDKTLFCSDCGDEVGYDNNGYVYCRYCQEVLEELCAELDWYRKVHGDCPTSVYRTAGRIQIKWVN